MLRNVAEKEIVEHRNNSTNVYSSSLPSRNSSLNCGRASLKLVFASRKIAMQLWKHDFRGKKLVFAIAAAACQAFLLLGFDQGQ